MKYQPNSDYSSDDYEGFIDRKTQLGNTYGFDPVWMPDFLFGFQKFLVEWQIKLGRGAVFADCGMGKTPMELVVAENIVRKTNGNVLLLTPLAVGPQIVREGEKFGVEAKLSRDGKIHGKITVTNYSQLHKFDWKDFTAVICDESSILKSFDGSIRGAITEFMRKVPYRSLWTATAAPNDYTELGTSSEALGHLGYVDMLNMFFVNDRNNSATRRMYGEAPEWRFKGHAEEGFWRWVCSWARAVRKPADIGFNDPGFDLTDLREIEHMVDIPHAAAGEVVTLPKHTLAEQREERKRTIRERCEHAASLVNDTGKPATVWCHLNPEGDLLEKLIPGAVQVSGRDSDEAKEEKLTSFATGKTRVLVTKPIIGAWGLNLQHCSHMVYFPSHSYEQYYQSVRRHWRFGQVNPVVVDLTLTEGERKVMENLRQKSTAADVMFQRLVEHMNHSISVRKENNFNNNEEIPTWL